MPLRAPLRRLAGSRPQTPRNPNRSRPHVERLDDRLVPTRVLADFGAGGLADWNFPTGWELRTTADPVEMDLADNGDIFAAFGPGPLAGLWRQPLLGPWQHLTGLIPQRTEVGLASNVVFADFGSDGLWRWALPGGWQQLTNLDAQQLDATGPDNLYADFGSMGLWRWTPPLGFRQLSTLDAEDYVIGSVGGELYADFGTSGVWRWRPATPTWEFLTPFNPEALSASGFTLFADLGSAGLWRWQPAGWTLLTDLNPVEIDAGPGDGVCASFTGLGLWYWSVPMSVPPVGPGTWTLLTASNPTKMVVSSNGDLYCVFSTLGVWRRTFGFSPAWQQLTALVPEDIVSFG
jgi:hypothetical protein